MNPPPPSPAAAAAAGCDKPQQSVVPTKLQQRQQLGNKAAANIKKLNEQVALRDEQLALQGEQLALKDEQLAQVLEEYNLLKQ